MTKHVPAIPDVPAPTTGVGKTGLRTELPLGASVTFDDAPTEHWVKSSCVLHVQKAAALGAQGTVYRVVQDDGELRALKVFDSEEEAKHEWELLVALQGERAIPEPYRFGKLGDDAPAGCAHRYAVLEEFIEGRSLQECLLDPGFRRSLTFERALSLVEPVIRFTTNATEARGAFVNRDIKPDNLILDARGRLRLVDLGISVGAGHHFRGQGTGLYGAPELRDPHASIATLSDPRIDVYSIAAVLYTLLNPFFAPPLPGQASAAELLPLRHDPQMVAGLRERVAEEMAGQFDMPLAEGDVAAAVDQALASSDAVFAASLLSCLEPEQEARPLPAKQESLLLPDEERHERMLVDQALIHCLHGIATGALSCKNERI